MCRKPQTPDPFAGLRPSEAWLATLRLRDQFRLALPSASAPPTVSQALHGGSQRVIYPENFMLPLQGPDPNNSVNKMAQWNQRGGGLPGATNWTFCPLSSF